MVQAFAFEIDPSPFASIIERFFPTVEDPEPEADDLDDDDDEDEDAANG